MSVCGWENFRVWTGIITRGYTVLNIFCIRIRNLQKSSIKQLMITVKIHVFAGGSSIVLLDTFYSLSYVPCSVAI